jgi:arylsulfatase I/J
MDLQIGLLVDSLKDSGMWENTLIMWGSDNGGPVYRNGDSGANNWPLRGGKAGNFEGGIRSAAFASGGLLPPHRRGIKLDGLAGIWDWYATFAHLAGVNDLSDPKALAAGLPPVDSLNLWPYLSGKNAESPRKEIAIGTNMWQGKQVMWGAPPSNTIVVGVIADNRTSQGGGLWKYLIDEMLMMDGWQGPEYPNATFTWYTNSSLDCAEGCLFQLDADESEHHDVVRRNPGVVEYMHSRLVAHNATVFSPDRGVVQNETACAAAMDRGGFWGPFADDVIEASVYRV